MLKRALPDVISPDGRDVMQLAERIQMPGGPDDRNAPQWSEAVSSGHADSLDGIWYEIVECERQVLSGEERLVVKAT